MDPQRWKSLTQRVLSAALLVAEALGIAVAAAFPLVAQLSAGGPPPAWAPVALAGAVIALLSALLFRRQPLEYLPRAAGAVALSWLWVGLLAATVVRLRAHGGGGAAGFGWVVLAFAVTWGNDTFAYFTGIAFGRHRLYERISPKKSWEGAVGGGVGALAGAFLVRAFLLPGLGAPVALAAALGGSVVGPL